MSCWICYPFEKINNLVKAYRDEKPSNNVIEQNNYTTYEFDNLYNFLNDSFKAREEKHAAEKYIAKMAAEVAHDISAPLVVMQLTLETINNLDNNTKTLLHNVAGRIKDIANYLLTEYKNPKINSHSELAVEFVPDLIRGIISEKELFQQNKHIIFNFNIEDDAHAAFARINKTEFQRALSNLTNNSIEAINDSGKITINLKSTNNKILIEIIDIGTGIPQNLIDKITRTRFTYGKVNGTGLGLSYAIDKVKSWGGDYNIDSKVGDGTKITLILPQADHPPWFQKQITIPKDKKILVLDNKDEIYQELAKRFDNIIHCKNVQEFETHVSQSNIGCYLIRANIKGICPEQLIKDLNIQQSAFLVADKHIDKIFMGICQAHGIKIIPQSLVSDALIPTKYL